MCARAGAVVKFPFFELVNYDDLSEHPSEFHYFFIGLRTETVWARIGSVSGPYRFGIGPYWILLDSKNTYLDFFRNLDGRRQAAHTKSSTDHRLYGLSANT